MIKISMYIFSLDFERFVVGGILKIHKQNVFYLAILVQLILLTVNN